MSNRFRFVKACVVGAVLSGTALISTDAFAQCCQGGSADRRQCLYRRLGHLGFMAGRPVAVAGGQRVAAKGATGGAVLVDPRRNRGRRTRLSQRSDSERLNMGRQLTPVISLTGGYALSRPAKLGEVLRVQHCGAGRVRRRPCRHRHQRWSLPNRFVGQQYRLQLSGLQRSVLYADRVEGRRAILHVHLGSDAACVQHQRADDL